MPADMGQMFDHRRPVGVPEPKTRETHVAPRKPPASANGLEPEVGPKPVVCWSGTPGGCIVSSLFSYLIPPL